MEMHRLIDVYAAMLYKIGKIARGYSYRFHLRRLYHMMRYGKMESRVLQRMLSLGESEFCFFLIALKWLEDLSRDTQYAAAIF